MVKSLKKVKVKKVKVFKQKSKEVKTKTGNKVKVKYLLETPDNQLQMYKNSTASKLKKVKMELERLNTLTIANQTTFKKLKISERGNSKRK